MRRFSFPLSLMLFLLLFGFCASKSGEYAAYDSTEEGGEYYSQSATSTEEQPHISLRDQDMRMAGDESTISPAPVTANNQESAVQNRKIIRNASFSLKADDFEVTRNALVAKAKELGGDIFNATFYDTGDNTSSGTLTIRLPSVHFEKFISGVRSEVHWHVLNEQISSTDVTEEYTDLDLRLGTLKKAVERLNELLNRTGRLSDILEIERELTSRLSEIERIEGRMRLLDDRVSLSTFTINIYVDKGMTVEEAEDIAQGLTDSWDNTGNIFENSLKALLDLISYIWIALIAIIPWLLALAAGAGATIGIVKLIRRIRR